MKCRSGQSAFIRRCHRLCVVECGDYVVLLWEKFQSATFCKNVKRAGEMVQPLETWGDGMDHHTCRHSLPPWGARRRSQERRESIISAQWICTPRVRFLIVLHILTVNHLAHRYWYFCGCVLSYETDSLIFLGEECFE